MKEIKRLDVTKDYDKIFALSEFAFQYELSKAEVEEKIEETKRHTIWGWMDGDEIAAKLHLLPLSIYINGQALAMGGIAGVATWPEYRRQGMVKHLLGHAIQEMKQNGQTVSLLYPFSVPFYRKYGWEVASSQKDYSIPMERFRQKWETDGYVRRIQQDIPLLHAIYTEYVQAFSGPLVRDEKWWQQRVIDKQDQIAVAYDEQENAVGYILYQVKEKLFTITELAYRTHNGRKLLLQFIANHDSMAKKVKLSAPENDNLRLLLDNPVFEQKLVSTVMARIVDVEAFLKQYPFQNDSKADAVVLHVEDSFSPENTGVYELLQTDKGIEVTRVEDSHPKAGIHCSIQVLTSIFFGDKRPMEWYELGRIKGNMEEVNGLEALIPQQQTYIMDFF